MIFRYQLFASSSDIESAAGAAAADHNAENPTGSSFLPPAVPIELTRPTDVSTLGECRTANVSNSAGVVVGVAVATDC